MSSYLYLDTETTGIGAGHALVEIAIVDDTGAVLLDSLINPLRRIPSDASGIHGITDKMVANAPALGELWPEIQKTLRQSHTVIYNASFDRVFFPDQLRCANRISCAMLEFARAYGERDRYGRSFKWQKLDFATAHVGYRWKGDPHRALADALACRAVWQWLRRNK